jgi:hypothetical protein
MPWHCPACQEQIRHSEAEERPRPGVIYRCHICRLELTLDMLNDTLIVVPVRDGENDKRRDSG